MEYSTFVRRLTYCEFRKLLFKNVLRTVLIGICVHVSATGCLMKPEDRPVVKQVRKHALTVIDDVSPRANPFPHALPNEILSQLGEQHYVRVTLKSEVWPVPLNKLHQWQVFVEKYGGEPVTDAIFSIEAGIFLESHTAPVRPHITQNFHDGYYRLGNVKFNMRGHWKLIMRVISGSIRDKVVFDILI